MMPAFSDFIRHFVFEQPWPAAIGLAVLAAILNVVGQRNRQKLLRRGSLVIAILAGAILALGYTTETNHEAVDRHTRALIATTAPLDLPAFEALLASDARLLGADGAIWLEGRDILTRLDSSASNYELDQRITGLTVESDNSNPDQLTAILDLRTKTANTGGLPLLTSWALTWQLEKGSTPTVWRLQDAQWLRFNQQPPTQGLVK